MPLPQQRFPTTLILILLALLLLVPLLALSVIHRETPRIEREELDSLGAIARLKSQQIEAWRAERLDDGASLMSRDRFISDVGKWLDHRDPVAEARLAIRQASLRHGFHDWTLVDAAASGETPVRRSLVAAAQKSGRPQFGELYRDAEGQTWLDLAVPLTNAATGKAVGAVILRSKASQMLFPILRTWVEPSTSAETLLLRRDGDSVLFLSELRHRKGAVLPLRLPLNTPNLPAAGVLHSGQAQTMAGRDYRGTPVLAALQPISDSAWFLLTKVDRAEVMQPFHTLVTWVAAVSAVALLVLVAALLLHWRRQQGRHQQELIARTGDRDRLLSLFYDLPFMGMAIIDPEDGHWLHVNQHLCDILGYEREHLLAYTTWKTLTHPDDVATDLAEYERVLAGQSDGYQLEKRFLRRDGTSVEVAIDVKCVRHGDGQVEYIVKTVRDIGDSKRLAAARADRQRHAQLLAVIAESSKDTIFAKDLHGSYLFYNQEAADALGRRPEEVVGHEDTDLFPPEQARQIQEADRRIMASGEPVTYEETLTTATGERTYLTTKGPLLADNGEVFGLYGISRDITARVAIEEQVRQSQQQLQLFIENAPLAIAMFDREMNYLAWSRRWLADYGQGCDDLIGRNHYLIYPDLPKEWRENNRRALAGEALNREAERWVRDDGRELWVRWAILPWRDATGAIGGIIISVDNITTQEQAKQALAESSARLAGIIDSAMDAIITLDQEQRIHMFNPAAERMFGYRAEEVLGQGIDRLLPSALRQAHRHHVQQFATEGTTIRDMTALGELHALRRDGSEFPIEASISKVCIAGEQSFTAILRDISQRRQAEDALRVSEERYRSLVEQAADGIFVSDAHGFYLDVNSAACAMLGYPREELIGRNIADVVDPAEIPRIGPEVARFADGAVVVSEWRFRRRDGSVFPGEVSGRQLADGRLQAILRDISERKAIEAALRYQLDLTRSITEKSTDSIFITDAEGRVTAVNPEAEKTFGYTAGELAGRVLHEVIHHHHRDGRPYPMHECPLCHVYKSGEVIRDHETAVFRRDGSRLVVTGSNAALESGGKPVGAALVLHDISALREADLALREREDDLNRAQTVGHMGSWRLDVRRNELIWSAENHNIFGVPPGTPMTYEFFLACVHTDDRTQVDREWQAALHGAPYDIEHRLLVHGQVKWVREKAELDFDEQGNLVGGFGITQDISDMKAAEQALRESEQRFQLAAEIGRSGTWDWNVQTGEVIWSRGLYEILGYREGEVAPGYQSWIERVHPEDRLPIEARMRHSKQERIDYVAEFRVVWPDTSLHWMSARARYEYGEDGNCARMLGVMADITSLKQAELALRETDQRKDEFLAMLAHELRNPLTPIRNAAHVLGKLDIAEPRVRWAQDIIERQVTHLTHLVDELLDVSRIARGKVSIKKTRIALSDLIHQACESVQPLMTAKGHRFDVVQPDVAVMLDGDLIRLLQVLQNLLNNAAKYTPDGGNIELLARQVGQEIEIMVRDNGMGIGSDLLPWVFDLFRQGERTLDRAQGGLGIGLTLVHRLVELHGGRVHAHSAGTGLGASFTVRLPLADPTPALPAATPTIAATAPGHLRVLVVDDDPVVAESMVVFLELEGHQVRSAASGEAAMPLLKEFLPQLVLLDIGLPGQNGYEVARRIRQTPEGKDVKLVAVSGYGHEEAVARGREAGFDRHLIKPVAPEVLDELLAEFGRIA